MSSEDEQAPDVEVLGRMTFTRHSGADFEANRTGRRRGEQLPGVDVVDAREPEPGSPVRSHRTRARSATMPPGPRWEAARRKWQVAHAAQCGECVSL